MADTTAPKEKKAAPGAVPTNVPNGATATAQPAASATQPTAQDKLALSNKAIATLQAAGIEIPASLANDKARLEKEIQNAELSKKYQKLTEFMQSKAVEIQKLGMDAGSYNVAITLTADGKVNITAKGGARAASATPGTGVGKGFGKGRAIVIAGVTYPSAAQACRDLGIDTGVSAATMVLKRKNIDFVYADEAGVAVN